MIASSESFFLDTNIISYALDTTEKVKHGPCNALLEKLLSQDRCVISTQVMQETFVALTKASGRAMHPSEAREILRELATWRVAQVTPTIVVEGARLCARYQIAFWDGLIIAAAEKAKAAAIFSEDLNHGQTYAGIPIINPLKPDFDLDAFLGG